MDDRAEPVAKALVSCHETYPPTARPRYGQIAVMRDGPAKSLQVTFGAHQATDRADSLDKILVEFRRLAIAVHGELWDDLTLADELVAYLPRLAENTPQSCAALARDRTFVALLERSAADPLMAEAQDNVFDRDYMKPALAAVQGSGWVDNISLALVYDLMIHGSWPATRDRVHGNRSERDWVRSCVDTRHYHLSTAGSGNSIFGNKLLRATTYRMRTFRMAIAQGNWQLATPFTTGNDATVTEADVDAWRHV